METVKTQIGVCHKVGPFPGTCGREVGHACVYVDGIHSFPEKGPYGKKEEELLANAVLMAASPDLLAACRLAEDYLSRAGHSEDDSTRGGVALKVIREAISKAIVRCNS